MCLAASSIEPCDNFVPNERWMKATGNACWGMGAGNNIPCLNCGSTAWRHQYKDLDDYGQAG